jgi:hypothetical protein
VQELNRKFELGYFGIDKVLDILIACIFCYCGYLCWVFMGLCIYDMGWVRKIVMKKSKNGLFLGLGCRSKGS